MSPRPRSCSAPFPSSTVRESTLDATWKAIRVGKFALMSPVTTSTDGRWVAMIRWMPTARAICASLTTEVCTSRGGHHEVGELVDDDDPARQPLLGRDRLVVALDRADLAGLEQLVALVHLPDDPAEPDRKSTRLNSSHTVISYAVFCLKKKNKKKST